MLYHKKIDKSFFKYWFTIPVDYINIFLCWTELLPWLWRDVALIWQWKKYNIKMYHVDRKKWSVYQIRWDHNSDLTTELKKEFIQSYFAIESQNFESKKKWEYYVTNLLWWNQEIIEFEIISCTEIKAKPFVKITTSYDNLFKAMVDENVFWWLSKEKNTQMISKFTEWFDYTDLYKHEDKPYVIYYLLDEKNNEIYIWSAKRLGDRVKLNRKEIPGWNRFRYELIHPKYHEQIKELEYHSIMNFARFFNNHWWLTHLCVSNYKLVNKDYKFYLN